MSFLYWFVDKPEWASTREGKTYEFYGFISGTANLTCVVVAEPPADFAWYRVKTLSGTTQSIQMTKDSEYKNDEKITKELYPSAQIVNENGKSTLMVNNAYGLLNNKYKISDLNKKFLLAWFMSYIHISASHDPWHTLWGVSMPSQ